MIAGTVSQSLRLEALQVRLKKSEDTVVPQVKYSSYSSKNGWGAYLKNGDTTGTTGINLEALKIALENVKSGVSVKFVILLSSQMY